MRLQGLLLAQGIGGTLSITYPAVFPRQLFMAISHHDHKKMRLSSLRPQFPVTRPTYMSVSFFLLYLLWRMAPGGFMWTRQALYLSAIVPASMMHCPVPRPTSASASAHIHHHQENGQENGLPGVSQRTDPGYAPRVPPTASPVRSTQTGGK